MANEDRKDPGYAQDGDVQGLELIWGEGFMSPGGPAEISRILGGKTIVGCEVLDIGSGLGGADIVLVREHGAGTVVGIDVEERLIELASHRSVRLGLEDRIKYQLVKPGLLPFANDSFGVVFSKDAIIHVRDKKALYSEALRVLRPGGWVLVSDWLGGEGETSKQLLEEFVAASGHDFTMVSLREMGEIVEDLGFVEIDLEDRQTWYLEEARGELHRLRGPLKAQYLEVKGEEPLEGVTTFWEILVMALEEGAMRPGHIRAMKPTLG